MRVSLSFITWPLGLALGACVPGGAAEGEGEREGEGDGLAPGTGAVHMC